MVRPERHNKNDSSYNNMMTTIYIHTVLLHSQAKSTSQSSLSYINAGAKGFPDDMHGNSLLQQLQKHSAENCGKTSAITSLPVFTLSIPVPEGFYVAYLAKSYNH